MTDDYVNGFEYKMIYDQMIHQVTDIRYCISNDCLEPIKGLAKRLCYSVIEVDKWRENWIFIHLRRNE